MKDKPAIFILVGIFDEDMQKGILTFQCTATYSEKLNVIIHIYYNSSTSPCFKCRAGNYCKNGGLWLLVLKEDPIMKEVWSDPEKFSKRSDAQELLEEAMRKAEKRLNEFKFTPDKFQKWDQ